MWQACECRTQQEIMLFKRSDIFYIMPPGSPVIINGRTFNGRKLEQTNHTTFVHDV